MGSGDGKRLLCYEILLGAGQQLLSFGQRQPKWARRRFAFDHCEADGDGFAEIVDQAGLDNHLYGSLRANLRIILPCPCRMCAPALARSPSRLRAIQLKLWKWGGAIYRELGAKGATHDVAKQVAVNGRRWWRNSAQLLNGVLTVAHFDRMGLPRLS